MISKTFINASVGGALGAAQALGFRILDQQLATTYLKSPTTAFNPKIVKPLKGFGTVGNLTNLGLSAVELYGGNHYINRGRQNIGETLSVMGGAGLIGFVINGAMPSQAVQNVIAADPSNPIGYGGARVSRPVIRSAPVIRASPSQVFESPASGKVFY